MVCTTVLCSSLFHFISTRGSLSCALQIFHLHNFALSNIFYDFVLYCIALSFFITPCCSLGYFVSYVLFAIWLHSVVLLYSAGVQSGGLFLCWSFFAQPSLCPIQHLLPLCPSKFGFALLGDCNYSSFVFNSRAPSGCIDCLF